MECTWDAALLRRGGELPPELLDVIQHGNHAQYLAAITKASLDPRYTYLLFAHCEDVFAHICASLRSHGSLASAVATLGRVVPFAPFLMPYAERLLAADYTFSPSQDSDEDLLYLLGLFRLFSFEQRALRDFVQPSKIAPLLESSSRPLVYVAIRILQTYFHGADHWFEQMIKRYLGDDSPNNDINGQWDDRIIDYRFLTLWEEDRFRKVWNLTEDVKSTFNQSPKARSRILPSSCFGEATALIGGILLPRVTETATTLLPSPNVLIQTPTVHSNLRQLAFSLKSTGPLLLQGPSGAGKSLLIRYVAHHLGKVDKMVTLHLNQQSDAKLLMGIYTTGQTPGSFAWQPGVLTTAVQEGRWVLIEDIDRASDEIISMLLPLIERRELMIPNRKDIIQAAPGFKIIATARTVTNHRGQASSPVAEMLGIRHWQQVFIEMPPSEELRQVTRQIHPHLSSLLPQFHAAYERLSVSWQKLSVSRQSRGGTPRSISPRDLLKWCDRVSNLLQNKTTMTSNDMDDVFMEGVDCFAGALPDGQTRTTLAAFVAEELRLDPRRRDFLLTQRDVGYALGQSRLTVGRYALVRSEQSRKAGGTQSSFSTNPHTNRMLEKVAGGVINREPLLLVGETGVGKTAAVQHLATHLGKKLVPFNLSQQSEAGDLLGGFKPVNARSLFIPMKDEFDELFAQGFSLSKNRPFLDLLGKQTSRSNWKAVCKLWQQALKMVEQQRLEYDSRSGEAPNKKRKVESKKFVDFARWDAFAATVTEMERRLASRNDAFAFSFVEGNIVKALRNGDWILLDEINLASPDTLESIADLLDPTEPSLLLTESGSIERIEAHPGFRVFAAMNPATDVGKKDLPPGIRSRFTELYVDSPDKDIKSLSSIVQSYLRHEITGDQTVPVDVSKLYQNILELSSQNKLVDGAGSKPHFSLRTLTRTLSYAKYISPFCSLRRALYEGFQMSFLTLLDDESVRLVQPLIEQSLFGKRTNIRAELKKALRKPSDRHVQGYPGSKHWVHAGDLPIEEQPQYILTPFIRNNLENLVRATSTRQFPVLIQGPTSSGKTSMIEYLAKRTGHKFVRINNHEHTDLQEYLGTYVSGVDGRLQFQDGILVKALREGHWIVLDELNLAPTDVLEALNRLLDDNRELLIPETQEVIRPHDDFMLFATQNPAGLYGGRKALSRAFRNRFLELHFDDIPVDELQEILHRRTQLPESRCKRIVGVYRELSVLRQENRLFEQKSFATLRDLFRWAQRPNETIEQLAANGFMLLGERVRKVEDRYLLKSTIEKIMSEKIVGANGFRVEVDENQLYSEGCPEVVNYQQNVPDNGVVWTKAMRRLYVLVARALENNEPVLLVGETGCGKTTVCQMLAHALGKKLYSVNAHQNTETGDLIGSQRPIRNRAVIEANLRHQLLSSNLLQNLDNASESSTDTLLSIYDHTVASLQYDEKNMYSQSPDHASIQEERTRFKALFEWNDGSLVQAMKGGAFFLLDEISLADDSVLERLNSVLESQRSILLAEKGSIDSNVIASPGFQFLATMNPGGDYGKRELSPALRNRFTEIWVPPLTDANDVVQIVQEKLMSNAKSFSHAMIAFAQWFRDRYNTSASSSISIRDALSWVSLVNAYGNDSLEASVIHGAAMVYIDTLGANPAGLMATNKYTVTQERAACTDQLSQFLGLDSRPTYFAMPQVQFTGDRFIVGPFSLPKKFDSNELSDFSFEPVTTKINAMRVVRALQLSKPIMLEGDPGVGKTTLITAIAEAAGVPLTRLNLSEQTDLMDLFGSDVPLEGAETGNFAWRDASFLRAMKNGEWVLLDEMNLASQSVLEGLNACLDHRGEVFVPELGQTFDRHPDFKLFAAQNPHHQGGGRKGLPASFVNRFTVVYADAFRPDDLKLISQRSFLEIDPVLVDRIIAFVDQLSRETSQSKHVGTKGAPWEFNYRDISRLLSLATSKQGLLRSGNVRDFTDLLFSQRFRSAHDRAFVDGLSRHCFGDDIYTTDMSFATSTRHLQLGLAVLPRNVIAANAIRLAPETLDYRHHLRILQSIMLCVQQNWPVVVAGRSGAGKTELIKRLAATVGANLVTLAINSETDAMDLIGGFEQTDLNWHADQSKRRLHETASLDALAALKEHATLSDQSHEAHTAQGNAEPIAKPKFEWIDGLLVDALQEGKWLVLDNANLCSPSVLDRLNSLLEPNGVLIVNERSNADGSPRVVVPHPDFRIFLTVNPRYGELSRAMRNRAVELYLPETGSSATAKDLNPLFSESAVSRLRQTALLNTVACGGVNIKELSHTMVDHFGYADEPVLNRFNSQVAIGLYGLFETCIISFNEALQPRSQLRVDAVQRSIQLYEAVLSQTQVPADFARAQTSHPLNNRALMQVSNQATTLAPYLAFIYDCSIQLVSMAKRSQTIRSSSTLVATIVRLERSFGLSISSTGIQFKSGGILGLVDTVVLQISRSLELLLAGSTIDLAQFETAMMQMIALGMILLETMAQQRLDAANFNALMAQGKSIAASSCQTSSDSELSPVKNIQNSFDSVLSKTGHDSNFVCSALWKALRPTTPANQQQYDALLQLEAIIERFDNICHRLILPLDMMSDLRLSFSRTLELATHLDGDVSDLSMELETLMPGANYMDTESRSRPSPHFLPVFRQLSEHLATLSLGGHAIPTKDRMALDIFALRGLKESQQCSGPTDRNSAASLCRLAPCITSLVDMDTDRYTNATVEFSLIDRLLNAEQVPLAQLDLLEAEFQLLGRLISSRAHLLEESECNSLDAALRGLVTDVISALVCQNNNVKVRDIATELKQRLEADEPARIPDQNLEVPTVPSFNAAADPEMLVQSLQAVITYFKVDWRDENTKLTHASNAWACVACTCLLLYVPKGAFDPSLDGHFKNQIYLWCFGNMTARLKALQSIREGLTGEIDSMRARSIQQDIVALGPPPEADRIYRPAVSQLSDLQLDLDALMRTLPPLCNVGVSFASVLPLSSNLISNITKLRRRLSTQYRAYQDFTAPIVGFMDCLLIAHRIAIQSKATASRTPETSGIGRVLPFIDASLDSWIGDKAFLEANASIQTRQEVVCWLGALAVRLTADPSAKHQTALAHAIEQRFGQFHQRWKSELEEERRTVSERSNLYKYRYQESESDEATSEELEGLFPTQSHEPNEAPLAESSPSARDDAVNIARLHSSIFLRGDSKKAGLQNLLREWVRCITERWRTIDGEHITPAVLLLLGDTRSSLDGSESQGRAYNIYTDPNVAQMKGLTALIHRLGQRFRHIQTSWPEHATPVEVLRHCDNILGAPYASPISGLLPRLEKLYTAVNDWQSIASRQFAVHDLLTNISELIISWRQLELSTWAGLFDREWEQCQKVAASWWYVAYDNIIAATCDIEESTDDLLQHTADLLSVLEDFVKSSGLGEFAARMQMLRGFEAHLAVTTAQTPRRVHLRRALANFNTFYGQFDDAVQIRLSEGREILEKEMRNVIQLASWKDRNIDVLRQSALSSHRKLLRLIRKFRNLLAQPVLPIISVGLHGDFKANEDPIQTEIVSRSQPDRDTLEVHSTLPVWRERPARYVSLYQTSRLMDSKMQRLQNWVDAPRNLNAFQRDLRQQISELQKSTPSTSTEENQTLIRHLKTRKRRLLADVLKAVRTMGFQSSVSEQVLHQQNSVSTIFAYLPKLVECKSINGAAAQYELHRLLCIMPIVRQSARKHSDELTSAEVLRCSNLLESILQVCITSHKSSIIHLGQFAGLEETLNQFKGVALSDGAQITSGGAEDCHLRLARTKALHLQRAVHAAIELLRIQGNLCSNDYSIIVGVLENTITGLEAILCEADLLPNLPPGLQDNNIVAIKARLRDLDHELQVSIGSFTSTNPETCPILLQLLKWTCAESAAYTNTEINGHATPDLADWVHELFETLDSILTSLQDVEKLLEQYQQSDSGSRPTEQLRLLHDTLHALAMQILAHKLSRLMSRIHYLDIPGSTSLSDAVAICCALYPIIESYQRSLARLLTHYCNFYAQLCNTGHTLATTFVEIANRGFCRPSEKSQDKSGESGEVEAGTGLGNGEGADDISKDVGDEEDLSEFAQDAKSGNEATDTDLEKDAVDMADEEMEGEFDDGDGGSEMDEEGSGSNEEEDANLDEEAGEDTLDSNAIDEKMWDNGAENKESQKAAESGKGSAKNEDMAAADDSKGPDYENLATDEAEDVGAMEENLIEQQEKIDPHVDEGSNLDLPDDMDTGEAQSAIDEDSDLASLADERADPADIDPALPDDAGSAQENDRTDQASEQENEGENELDQGVEEEALAARDEEISQTPELQVQEDPSLDETGSGAAFGDENEDTRMGREGADADQLQQQSQEDTDDVTNQNREQSKDGLGQGLGHDEGTSQKPDKAHEEEDRLPFMQLGDVLDQWYNNHRDVADAHQRNEQEDAHFDRMDMEGVEFEHLPDETATADGQAIGAASAEQSVALNEDNAIANDDGASETSMNGDNAYDRQEGAARSDLEDDRMQLDSTGGRIEEMQPTSFIGESLNAEDEEDRLVNPSEDSQSDDMDDVDKQMTNAHISFDQETTELAFEDAQKLWAKHEDNTRSLALILTEHLRLILQPTQATKMRGDFRTGKRLNIKRIIPYIASSYKRDKIWMRRSTPTKRSYQIMLAIDDSKSMAESQSHELAFDTLALIAKGMSMLEVGELSVVGFGEDVNVTHDFSTPFTSEAGARVFQQFTFSQRKTDVRRLLAESIALFRTARLRAGGSASDLWQLQLIISDGICDDHPSIRQLVREAHEERIMTVFVVVDFATQTGYGPTSSKQSILDMPTAQFIQDEAGNTQLKMMKYLDTFPFSYYLIVQNIQELPNVLAGALRQWFAEVMDSGG